ncbi:MAG: Uroporphyrinogen-III synthase [Candidatus Accumulibacter regalis]|mgnify:CR=1 FL=1|jgi:uroporphyrinogen-III synthase|uniref:Uroporphyrinogen-III synthase n=1 Tax=Accumulibacter regalis TaxID=522306 RepID=A0A011QGJ2_ACCRE|nr:MULTISPECIES: uroporphyrinogen-III synthase [unclassified Candidatus Accumulibacter]EXI88427.1 MAG: Uroporphyrinogen-III synthase [Candidatus Accumulibacter regalis]MBL8367785.1 uroporphyrinogen-III synthase [Accumulibacter sp.]MQM34897.1 uroporphyrinogen-III synthase [Candidatus Accumulibacter phosphatis]HRE71074.1 uroporphyrinogen-III synthase [Accumulibacter sp.]
MTEALRGKTIVVTRPRAQAPRLAAWIAEHGGEPLLFPLLEITPVDDPEQLRLAIAALDGYSLAIFISPNAVEHSVPEILAARQWPAGLQAVAIGQGSLSLLLAYGIRNPLAPLERFDSESLLELPALQSPAVAGQRVVIFRGNGGREFLADSLRERGAQVDYVSCYQRSSPASAAVLEALWRNGRLDALTVSSSEGLRNLVDLLDASARASLCTTPVFVPHQRIADLAQKLGLQRVILTEPADAGIIAALNVYNWRS